MLLRNPLGFVWHYGLRWRAPEGGDEPLVLDALAMGDLVHQTLDQALQMLEADGGLASAVRGNELRLRWTVPPRRSRSSGKPSGQCPRP